MKKGNNIRPVGLKGNDKLNRMKELMGSTSINEDTKRSVVELTKEGPDGNIYAIVRENQEYYIKISENKSNLVTEDFNYIGGLQNKKDKSFSSYSKAIKQLNLKFMSLNEAIGKSGQINVFEDDNLITEHHPLKADMKLSADKGIGAGDEYVVDKKGAELKYDNKEGKDADGFGDNVASSTAKKDVEKVKLSETEKAIDSMITGEEVIKENEVEYETKTISGYAGELKDYTHFAIHKPTNSIAGNWDYSGYDADELRYDKDDYFFIDIRDDHEGNMDKFRKGDFVIVTRKGLEKRGIDLNNYEVLLGQKYDKGGVNESKKGFSIARAIQEMDDVIDEISGDDKIDTILESLGEEERAIIMEALKKNVNETYSRENAEKRLTYLASDKGVNLKNLDDKTKEKFIQGIMKGIDITNELMKAKDRVNETLKKKD